MIKLTNAVVLYALHLANNTAMIHTLDRIFEDLPKIPLRIYYRLSSVKAFEARRLYVRGTRAV